MDNNETIVEVKDKNEELKTQKITNVEKKGKRNGHNAKVSRDKNKLE